MSGEVLRLSCFFSWIVVLLLLSLLLFSRFGMFFVITLPFQLPRALQIGSNSQFISGSRLLGCSYELVVFSWVDRHRPLFRVLSFVVAVLAISLLPCIIFPIFLRVERSLQRREHLSDSSSIVCIGLRLRHPSGVWSGGCFAVPSHNF